MQQLGQGFLAQRALADEAAVLIRENKLSAASTLSAALEAKIQKDPFLATYANFMEASVAGMDEDARGHWQDYLLKCALHWFDLVLPSPKPETFEDLTKRVHEQYNLELDPAVAAVEHLKTCALGDDITSFMANFNSNVLSAVAVAAVEGTAAEGTAVVAPAPLVTEGQLCQYFLDGLGRHPVHGARLKDAVVARADPLKPMTLVAIQELATVHLPRVVSNTDFDRKQDVKAMDAPPPRKIRAVTLEDLRKDEDPATTMTTTARMPTERFCAFCKRNTHNTADCRYRGATSPTDQGRTTLRIDGRRDAIGNSTTASKQYCTFCRRDTHDTVNCRSKGRPDRYHHDRDGSGGVASTGTFSSPSSSAEPLYCRHCKMAGHMSEKCRWPNGDAPICTHCHRRGHLVQKCHKLGHRLRGPPGDSRDERIGRS
ncbi:hypothetical protein HKX48_000141 [Thoreauomyces humboldtii]|nr:hypothetical protein HKX48_000141 [Thoreauomyces humboldtii]